MAEIRCLFVLIFLCSSTGADTEVSCVFMESCILPCSFQGGTDVVIHWIHVTAGDVQIHSYYYNTDQLAHQDQHFKGRTSMFKDQISRGNASLQLAEVKIQDQGRYKCYTSTIRGNKESYINLKINAPVERVKLEPVENKITCSSEMIYPEPELTWSTSPPSNMNFDMKPEVQRTEELLYNISSSLILSDPDVNYTCTVSTGSSRKRASWFKPISLVGSFAETVIQCSDSNTKITDLIWRFNHTEIILIQTRPDVPCTVSERWKQQVKGVSESASLLLQNLSSHHEGIYSCELSDAGETLISNNFLRIKESPETSENKGVTKGLVLGAVLVAVAAVIVFLVKRCRSQNNDQQGNTNQICCDQLLWGNGSNIKTPWEIKPLNTPGSG
uniref:Ig-like domain-containing protein n=1 Tax=Echeneis naucrates TaxID=173247 RepID=A0A665X6T0_ECHNA